jgi:fucose permease
MAPAGAPAGTQNTGALAQAPAWMVPLVVALFFIWGFATVLIDHLTPAFKSVFTLNFVQSNLTQFAFFIAYFVVSVPAGVLMTRIGYMKQGSGLNSFAGGHPTLALAGALVSLYWGGAMVGRLVGTVLLAKLKAGLLLTVFALVASLLAITSINSTGGMAFATIILIGLFNSIMFPTIFTLGIEGQGARTPQASGLLCMAIVGGAVVPLVTGAIADRSGLHVALYLPALCYLYIACFGFWANKAQATAAVVAPTAPVSA